LPIIAEDTLESLLLDHLQLIVDGKWAADVEIEDESSRDEDQLREQLERELEEIKRRKRKWQMAFANDVITLDELRERMAEERAREEAIMQHLSQLGQSIDHPVRRLTPQEVIEFARELRASGPISSPSTRRRPYKHCSRKSSWTWSARLLAALAVGRRRRSSRSRRR
jgi:Flagellar motor component